MIASIAGHWSIIAAIALAPALLAATVKVVNFWLEHLRAKRKQTDDVAMDLVGQLRAERAADREHFDAQLAAVRVEQQAERASCDAQLSIIRHRLANELTHSDALELAIRHAPDRAIAILDDARKMRSERAAQQRHDELSLLRGLHQQRRSAEALEAAAA